MNLSISNLAWDIADDEKIAGLLRARGIDSIDLVPGKYFPSPISTTDDSIFNVRKQWEARGIEIIGMQSLLFGTKGLNIFGVPAIQDEMLLHLAAICRIAAGLTCKYLVFGSPRNRDRSGLSDPEAADTAIHFFRRLADIADAYGVVVCLEPNPTCYGANFMTTSKETALIVNAVDHPAIRMQFDTGAIALNNECPRTVLQECANIIGHIHASEPQLVPLGYGTTDHAEMANAIGQYLPESIVSIEMLPPPEEAGPDTIEHVLDFAIRTYRDHRETVTT
ncbi:MAG: sugar phosphate isomerase/epimerase [Rhodocyclales bacterium GT-UBC]|nr:MAG: sugar phosphate isomerase/epimerase [Rhodocyclales bacterium GT-UBC]